MANYAEWLHLFITVEQFSVVFCTITQGKRVCHKTETCNKCKVKGSYLSTLSTIICNVKHTNNFS